MIRPFFCFVWLCLLGINNNALAQPMTFSLEEMDIVTSRMPPPPEEVDGENKDKKDKDAKKNKKDDKKKNAEEVEASDEPIITHHTFSTEVYPMSVTNIDWFSNRVALDKKRGIMIVLENKDEVALGWSNTATPYDVLFVQGNGRIQAIVPNLVLGELTDPLEITGRIKAVIYLHVGMAKELDIRPGDRVEHGLFKPSPLILQ